MRPFDIITFDCYGTLIDWEAGMAAAFLDAAAADGVGLDPAAVLRILFASRPAAEAPEYRTYRDILIDAAVRVGGRLGWAISRARAGFLPESLPRWPPFPDTNPALERLSQAGYTLGILSNVDDDLLAGTRQHFKVPFDVIVTAQQVRSYKPAPGHFTTARGRIGRGRGPGPNDLLRVPASVVKGRIPPANLLEMCRKSRSEQDCRKCLE